jgi:hypothetical protein
VASIAATPGAWDLFSLFFLIDRICLLAIGEMPTLDRICRVSLAMAVLSLFPFFSIQQIGSMIINHNVNHNSFRSGTSDEEQSDEIKISTCNLKTAQRKSNPQISTKILAVINPVI